MRVSAVFAMTLAVMSSSAVTEYQEPLRPQFHFTPSRNFMNELFVDRRRSRATPFHAAYPGRHAGPVRWRNDKINLRVLFDRSVVEVFANDGESVITDRVYPTESLERIELLPRGRAASAAARVWEMRSVWPER